MKGLLSLSKVFPHHEFSLSIYASNEQKIVNFQRQLYASNKQKIVNFQCQLYASNNQSKT